MASGEIVLPARVAEVRENGLWVWAPCDAPQRVLQTPMHCAVRLTDARHISEQQRKYIYATLRDIALYTGYLPEEAKAVMKYDYLAASGAEYFSLGSCSVSTACAFLEHLLEFCLVHGVPTQDCLAERAPDIERYVYMCLLHKKCCITGKPADLHHVDAVGMGRSRQTIVHQGMRVLPLVREKHNEAHSLGNRSFCEKYKLVPVTLDARLCEALGLAAAD